MMYPGAYIAIFGAAKNINRRYSLRRRGGWRTGNLGDGMFYCVGVNGGSTPFVTIKKRNRENAIFSQPWLKSPVFRTENPTDSPLVPVDLHRIFNFGFSKII